MVPVSLISLCVRTARNGPVSSASLCNRSHRFDKTLTATSSRTAAVEAKMTKNNKLVDFCVKLRQQTVLIVPLKTKHKTVYNVLVFVISIEIDKSSLLGAKVKHDSDKGLFSFLYIK